MTQLLFSSPIGDLFILIKTITIVPPKKPKVLVPYRGLIYFNSLLWTWRILQECVLVPYRGLIYFNVDRISVKIEDANKVLVPYRGLIYFNQRDSTKWQQLWLFSSPIGDLFILIRNGHAPTETYYSSRPLSGTYLF